MKVRPACPLRTLVPLLVLSATSCVSRAIERPDVPVVVIQTVGGVELGVATDDGILFLGRSAIEGPAKVTYWLDRAPVVEAGTIRSLGASIVQVELDVPVPTVPLDLSDLVPGEDLVMIGADALERWSVPVRAADSEIAQGSVVSAGSNIQLAPHHVGAGVYRQNERGSVLVGLVKGVATTSSGERWILLAGPAELRRALLEPKAAVVKREIRYRADGTRTILQRR